MHSDIAAEIAENWDTILDIIFHHKKRIYTYSFPIPLSSATPGEIGALRAGRMIYEWIEMAENDLVEEAYAYKYLVRTDVKNFYPSVYTHSIAWAIHKRSVIRSGSNRYNYSFLGNRLDKLFQNANDGCTNGLPIGPVVSDLIAEVILSAVDLSISRRLSEAKILALRFKDDYRFLCRTQEDCKMVTKLLQRGLKEFNLLLNEDKTEIVALPEGIFREWASRYHTIRPKKGARLTFQEFKELYLGVLQIDQEIPSTGIIDRFIADVTDSSYTPLFPISSVHIDKTISLLLLLAERRVRSFPRILGLVEAMMIASGQQNTARTVEKHLNNLLRDLSKDPEENRYLISWILYFLKSNRLTIRGAFSSTDPILKSIQLNRCNMFSNAKKFRLFRGVRAARHAGSLLKHLDVFKPQ
ncbi:MAG: RNA-directed DNA polymerase [Sedimentisphaerales bacterium]